MCVLYKCVSFLFSLFFFQDTKAVDFSLNPVYEPGFRFYDKSLLEQVKNGDQHVHEFFRILALCHTVMCDEKDGNQFTSYKFC